MQGIAIACPSEAAAFSDPIAVGRGVLVRAEDFAPSLAVALEELESVDDVGDDGANAGAAAVTNDVVEANCGAGSAGVAVVKNDAVEADRSAESTGRAAARDDAVKANGVVEGAGVAVARNDAEEANDGAVSVDTAAVPAAAAVTRAPSASLAAAMPATAALSASVAAPAAPLASGAQAGSAVPKILFICTGGIFSETLQAARALLMDNIYADIYSLRFIKPLDEAYLTALSARYTGVVLVEDGVRTGGIGEYVQLVLARAGVTNTAVKAFPDAFMLQGSRAEVLSDAGLSPKALAAAARALLAR